MALQSTVALATITLTSNTPSITFSNIPSNYKDLILVADWTSTADTGSGIVRFNNDSGSNYNVVALYATTGISVFSQGSQPQDISIFPRTTRGNAIFKIFEYASTDRYKSYVSRQNNAEYVTWMHAGKYSSLSPISSITLIPGADIVAGSTISLYGRIA